MNFDVFNLVMFLLYLFSLISILYKLAEVEEGVLGERVDGFEGDR